MLKRLPRMSMRSEPDCPVKHSTLHSQPHFPMPIDLQHPVITNPLRTSQHQIRPRMVNDTSLEVATLAKS